MAREPAFELSDELLTLSKRADLATEQARRLLDENDRWRRSVLQQLDYLFELGADFRRTRRPILSDEGPGPFGQPVQTTVSK